MVLKATESAYTYTGHRMQHPRPTHYKTNPRPPRQIPVRARRIAGRLLVPEADEPDPQVDGFLRYLDDGYAHDAEDDGDAEISETARDYTRAGWGRHDGEDRVGEIVCRTPLDRT